MNGEVHKLKAMLSSAAYEIRILRRANSEMAPRLQMFDDIMHMLSLRGPSISVTNSEDILVKIDTYFREHEEKVVPRGD